MGAPLNYRTPEPRTRRRHVPFDAISVIAALVFGLAILVSALIARW
jgi:hypothetical protein